MGEKSGQAKVEELRGTRDVRLPGESAIGQDPIVTALYLSLGTLMDELSTLHPGGPGVMTFGVGQLEVTGLTKLSMLDQDVLTESTLRQRDPDARSELARGFEAADILEIPGLKSASAAVVIAAELVRERLVPGSRGDVVVEAGTTRYRSARRTPGVDDSAAVTPAKSRQPCPSVPAVGLTAATLAALTAVVNGGLTLFGVLSSAPAGVQLAAGSMAVFGFGVTIALTGVWFYRRLRACRFVRRDEVDRELAVLTQRLDVHEERLEAAGV